MQTEPLPRLWGIDLARFVAIVGMMAAHLVVIQGDSEWLRPATSGFPSTLFAVLGGFGLVFAARRYSMPTEWKGAGTAGFTRGTLVLLLGLLMELLPPHPIYVILVYYGAALILLAPLVVAPTWVILTTAALLAAFGPSTIAILEHPGYLDYSSFGTLIQSILVGGTYPVITWVVYMLVGMALCRWMLRLRASHHMLRAATGMFVSGAIVGGGAWMTGLEYRNRVLIPELMTEGFSREDATRVLSQSGTGSPSSAGWAALLEMNPHSGTLVDLLRTGGTSVAIIGLMLLIAYALKKVPSVLLPVVGMGAAPLTSYTLHLVMTSFTLVIYGGVQAYFDGQDHPLLEHAFAVQMVVLLLLGAYLGFTGKRGPLELLVSRAAQASARAVEKTARPG